MKSIAMIFCLVVTSTVLHAQHVNPKEPPPPPPPPPKATTVKAQPPVAVNTAMQEFYDRNPGVARLTWRSEDVVIVSFKEKTKKSEAYNLAIETEAAAFHEKYGEAPLAPPPPPPPPPKAEKEIQ